MMSSPLQQTSHQPGKVTWLKLECGLIRRALFFSPFFRLCPIFQVSNVTGHHLDLLKSFLSLLSARMHSHEDKPAEFQIDETYSVPVSKRTSYSI